MNEIELAKHINSNEPLNRFRTQKEIISEIAILTNEQRLNLLCYSFQNYDNAYNRGLSLNYPSLWREFKEADWQKLILKMFPRKVKYEINNTIEINTGSYFDIFLLNGIIGISPFEFIFCEPTIEKAEKAEFLNYLKFYGEHSFYCNERELLEDVVNFYELTVFTDIVKVKEELSGQKLFEPSINYSDLLIRYAKQE